MAVVRVNSAQFDRAARLLRAVAGGVELAGSRAINDTLKSMRAASVRKIRETFNLKARVIRNQLLIRKANRNKLEGRLDAIGNRQNFLHEFGAKQTRRGVTYKIQRRGPRKLVPGAWLGARTGWVMVRAFKDTAGLGPPSAGDVREEAKEVGLRARVGRRPTLPVFGPSLNRVFADNVQATVAREGLAKLEERLDFHIDKLLKQAGR